MPEALTKNGAIGQPLYSSQATAVHTPGELAWTPDGRMFRYCKAGGTTLVVGKLQQAAAEDTTNFQDLTVTAPSAGATSITTTTTVTLTANQLAGGYLIVVSATAGAGQTFRISSHPAVTAAVVTFQLLDPVVTTCTGTVKVDAHPHPYSGVVVNPTTITSIAVGVAV